VFATLHTNSAPESIIRLLDMGMDPFNFADALLGILAQRLAKRLCGKCKKPHEATPEEIQALLTEFSLELKNTESWKKDPKAAEEKVLEDWVKNYGNENGKLVILTRWAARSAAAAATRAASACTNCWSAPIR
jgi:hypothetical protein